MLSPHWLSTPVVHFVGFFILCPKTTSSFKFLWSLTIKQGCLYHAKIRGNQVLQLERKLLNVNFACLLQETARLFVSKLKNLDYIDIFFSWETEISRGDQVLSPRYFLQRMITEHNSIVLMGGMSRSNSVEEIGSVNSLFRSTVCFFIDQFLRIFKR